MTTTEPAVRNGVDTATLFATIDAVRAQPAAAAFQFRATNRWVSGTHSRGYVQGFFGVGAEDTSREEPFVLNADHPKVLVGQDQGPTPVEYLLHALAACLTAGVANIAAARGITLHSVESSVDGDIDLRGILGLDPEVRNGFDGVWVRFTVDADADDDVVAALVEQAWRAPPCSTCSPTASPSTSRSADRPVRDPLRRRARPAWAESGGEGPLHRGPPRLPATGAEMEEATRDLVPEAWSLYAVG
jgi:uncharacterized OsmC-like protein